MAYAERRGKYYRGRYKNPDGVSPKWGTVSEGDDGYPFLKKSDALKAAQDQETEIRRLIKEWEGPVPDPPVSFEEWTLRLRAQRRARGERDPSVGAITLQKWAVERWLPAQDLEPRTIRTYRQRLKTILARFGDRPVNTLTDVEEIGVWVADLRQRYQPNTVDGIRGLLATILRDAVDARMVDVNAAEKRRRRGRVSARRMERSSPNRPWLTPLQVLLLAERTAAITGRDDDFIMWVTAAWCGLRWGELVAVSADKLTSGRLRVEQQLIELDGGFALAAPKDASFRNDDPRFFGALDLPPFLLGLLRRQVRNRPQARCGCAGVCASGQRFLFLSRTGGHLDERPYGRYVWHPAVTGLAADHDPPRRVLVDLAAGFPGRPVSPTMRDADAPGWRIPPKFTQPGVDNRAVVCRTCGAEPGTACVRVGGGRAHSPHRGRVADALAAGHGHEWELAQWLPLRPEEVSRAVPHGMRHSLRVWMDEDRIPEVLVHDRLGHTMPGIGGTYAHASPAMRTELVGCLQVRWEMALKQRAEMSGTSAVPVLAELLAGRLEDAR